MSTFLVGIFLISINFITTLNSETVVCDQWQSEGYQCGPCSNLSTDEECILDCSAWRGCWKSYEMICNDGHPCKILCTNDNTCDNMIVNAGTATSLEVICDTDGIDDDNNACLFATINAQNVAGDVTLECNHDVACNELELNCGTGACSIDCEEPDNCWAVTIDASSSNHVMFFF